MNRINRLKVKNFKSMYFVFNLRLGRKSAIKKNIVKD